MSNILADLLTYQRKNLKLSSKLDYNDLKRLTKYIDKNFFTSECCIWAGKQNKKKSNYITFYYRKKKVSLYRILYYNFVGNLTKTEFIRCSCDNKGSCCNVNHLKKYRYTTPDGGECEEVIDVVIEEEEDEDDTEFPTPENISEESFISSVSSLN